jgi:glycosyltransferase involved in cell wall biosynthesis
LRACFARKLGLWAIDNADHVVAVSNSLRSIVVDDHGADPEKVSVIPNGVDVRRFAPIPQEEARSRLGLDSEGPMILYVGAIARTKGIEYLLRAISLLDSDLDSVRLVLVGDGEYEHAARALADELSIAPSVEFAGKKPHGEMPLWMNACDLLTLPSLGEGFGLVLIEAMACGKPVVATACGGPEDIVTPQTGMLIPPGDEHALASAMQDTLSAVVRFQPQVVRQHVLDHFAHDVVTPRILMLYREALRL